MHGSKDPAEPSISIQNKTHPNSPLRICNQWGHSLVTRQDRSSYLLSQGKNNCADIQSKDGSTDMLIGQTCLKSRSANSPPFFIPCNRRGNKRRKPHTALQSPMASCPEALKFLGHLPASWTDGIFKLSLTSTLTVQLMRFSLFSSCMMVL